MFIGAYWDARKESRQHCAVRISSILSSLAQVHVELSAWCLKGRSKKTASKAVGVLPEEIEALLRTNNRDSDGSAISELGFNVGMWNGSDRFPCSLTVTCGGYAQSLKNSVVLQLPEDKDVLSQAETRKILECIIAAFDPEHALVTSHQFIDHCGGGPPWEAGGWLVYRRSDGIENIELHGTFGLVS
jgi:hypothetical protein